MSCRSPLLGESPATTVYPLKLRKYRKSESPCSDSGIDKSPEEPKWRPLSNPALSALELLTDVKREDTSLDEKPLDSPNSSSARSSDSGLGLEIGSPEVPDAVPEAKHLLKKMPPAIAVHNVTSRRRPGRPPGSGKRPKLSVAEVNERRKLAKEDDFSLRRFFEAGGRDYNDYLEWQKRERAERLANGSMTSLPAFLTQPPPPPPPPPPHSTLPSGTAFHRPVFVNCSSNATVYRPPVLLPLATSAASAPLHSHSQCLPKHETTVPHVTMSHIRPEASVFHPYLATRLRHCATPHSPRAPTMEPVALDLSRRPPAASSLHVPTSPALGSSSASTTPGDVTRSSSKTPSPPLVFATDVNGNMTTELRDSADCQLESWNVERVIAFLQSVPGCAEYAETFREQQIDGSTLPYLSEEHLVKLVRMKIGPAIKLKMAVRRLLDVAAAVAAAQRHLDA